MTKHKIIRWIVDASTGCHICISHKPPSVNGCMMGYPQYGDGGKNRSLHRVILERKIGRSLESGEVAMHTCDVKMCINPDHLVVGTQKDNMEDATKKGLMASGERCGRAKLTNEQAIAIAKSNKPLTELAEEYGVRYITIYAIKTGQNFTRVTGLSRRALGRRK